MRHHRDPRRTRHRVQLVEFTTSQLDSNGDPIMDPDPVVIWQGLANVQPWLPRYNIPTAPITGGVAERRVAARVYLPPEAPVSDKVRVYDVTNDVYYTIISSALEMAGSKNMWRVDLGAPRVRNDGG